MFRLATWRSIRTWVSGCLLILALLGAPEAVHATPSQQFSVERQALGDALRSVARASGHQLLFLADDVSGLTSRRLSGRYTIDQVLRVLLRDANLRARRVSARTFVIERTNSRAVPRRASATVRPRPGAAPALPVASSPTVTPTVPEDPALTEILVAARRYEEPEHDIPLAISTFSGDDLVLAGADNVQDLDGLAPGLNVIKGNGGISGFFVRRIGQDDFIVGSDPGVGTYLNGVYLGRVFGSAIDMNDIERIEVLRGPQGILYGRNAESGAINIHANAPVDEFEAHGEVWTGSRNRLDLIAVANQPLSGSSALRIAAMSRSQDGWIDNLETGVAVGNTNRQSLRIGFRTDFASGTRLTLSGDYFRQRERGEHYNLARVTVLNDPDYPTQAKIEFWNRAIAPALGVEPFDSSYVSPMRTTRSTMGLVSNVDNWGVSATIEGQAGIGQWKSISAYRQVIASWGADYDRSPARLWIASIPEARQFQLSQEIHLTGLAASELRYSAGVYVFREGASDRHIAGLPFDAMEVLNQAEPHTIAAPGLAGLLCPNPDPAVNLASCLGGSQQTTPEAYARAIELQLAAPIYSSRRVTNLNAAVYGLVNYPLAPEWTASAGFRLSYEARRASYSDQTTGIVREAAAGPGSHWLVPTWSFSLSYQPTPDYHFYANWSRGYKAGGVNLRPLQGETELNRFMPEYTNSWEFGAKTGFLNGLGKLNISSYVNTYSNFQDFTYHVQGDRLVSRASNRANAVSYGFELDYNVILAPNLTLNGMFGHQEWHYRDYQDQLLGAIRLGRSQPLQLPASTLRTALKWEGPVGAGLFMAQADVRWHSRKLLYFGLVTLEDAPPELQSVYERPFTDFNLSMSFSPFETSYKFFLQVTNIFGADTRTALFNGGGAVAELWNEPRQVRVGARYDF
jgi:iron complex outermembrane receptor protein